MGELLKSALTVEFFWGPLLSAERCISPLMLKYRHLVASQVGDVGQTKWV